MTITSVPGVRVGHGPAGARHEGGGGPCHHALRRQRLRVGGRIGGRRSPRRGRPGVFDPGRPGPDRPGRSDLRPRGGEQHRPSRPGGWGRRLPGRHRRTRRNGDRGCRDRCCCGRVAGLRVPPQRRGWLGICIVGRCDDRRPGRGECGGRCVHTGGRGVDRRRPGSRSSSVCSRTAGKHDAGGPGHRRGLRSLCSLRPGHTRYDGDAVFAVSCGDRTVDPDAAGEAAFSVVGRAIEAAIRGATAAGGIPALEGGG